MTRPAALDDPILKRFRAALDQIYGERIERVVLYGSRAGADHRSGAHNVGCRLGWLAPVSEPAQCTATGCKYCSAFVATRCQRAGSRVADSGDSPVSASQGLRSFGQREVQRV